MKPAAQAKGLGAALGLLALALLILAPLFSQLRAPPQDWSWLAELACHEGAIQASGHNPLLPQSDALDACGYCSLLVHSPALAGQGVAVAACALVVPLSSARGSSPCLIRLFPAAQSRAPPAALG